MGENSEYYITCFVILLIAFIMGIGYFVITALSNDGKQISLMSTTSKTTLKQSIVTTVDVSGTATPVSTPMQTANITKDIDFSSLDTEIIYISPKGNKSITLNTSDTVVDWVTNFKSDTTTPQCFSFKRENNTYTVNANSCSDEDYVEITVITNDNTKTYKIVNEKDLKVYLEGQELVTTTKFTSDIIELSSNNYVDWSMSDETAIIYTDISSYNLKFKIKNNVKITLISQGGQRKTVDIKK